MVLMVKLGKFEGIVIANVILIEGQIILLMLGFSFTLSMLKSLFTNIRLLIDLRYKMSKLLSNENTRICSNRRA